MNRPILTISLLPPDWAQKKYEELHKDLVAELAEIPELGIKSEKDFYTLFPADQMKYGIDGTEIVVQMRIPVHRQSSELRNRVKKKIHGVLKKHLTLLHRIEFGIDMPKAEQL